MKSSFFVVLMFIVVTATAAPFQNGSFELPAQVVVSRGLPLGDTSVKGWRVAGTGPVAIHHGILEGDRVPYEFGGQQYLGFNGGNKPSGGTVQQTFDTEPGQAYEVSFVLGRTGGGKGELSMGCTLFSENGNPLGQTSAVPPPNLGWGGTNQFFFVATGTQATIVFRDTSPSSGSTDLLLDAVSITALARPTINLYAGVTLSGSIGRKYRIEYIDALGGGVWKELMTVTLSSSPQIVFDEESPGHGFRFYRVTLLE